MRDLRRFPPGYIAVMFFFVVASPLVWRLMHSDAALPPEPTNQPVAAATVAITPTPGATATAVPSPTASPSLAEIHPNELGRIMVLEYHAIGDQEERWTRTRENFRKDLEYLYTHGYYLIGMNELLDNRVNVPAGKTPVVLSFDDSNRSQFQFIVGANGVLKPDPKTAVGIIEDFTAQHPDFGKSALFCVLPGADSPNDFFGQKEYQEQKLQYLVQGGYEICNHTLWHADLSTISDKEIVQQLALATKAIQDLVSGYQVNTLDPPYGNYAKNRALMLNGSYEGTSYHHRAILRVGGGPMTAPNRRGTDFTEIPRIQAIRSELDLWLGYFEKHPEERYVSDGDPNRITFPVSLLKDFVRPPDAKEEPSPDPAYKLFRLR